MKNIRIFLNEIPNLNTNDFRLVKEKILARSVEKRVPFYLETPYNKLKCPFCNSFKKIKWGKRNLMQRYKCKECGKTFNSLTKTPLARLRKKENWLIYSNCLKQGITIRVAASICKIHKNTSFRWRHRFLENSNFIKAKLLGGIIDFKNIYFRESFKGCKSIPKRERRSVCVINSRDRCNNLFDLTDINLTEKNLDVNVTNKIIRGSILVADQNQIYKTYSKRNNFKFKKHIDNKESLTRSYKIDSVNSYSLEFQDWVYNHFRGVATKYLKNYVSWFRGLNEFNSDIRPLTILLRAKSIEKYRYQPLMFTDVLNKL